MQALLRTLAASLLAATALACAKHEAAAPAPLTLKVAAASDLSSAFDQIGAAFTKDTGKEVKFSFGSSGLLSKQLIEGAPYDMFASANASFVEDTIKAGACDPASKAVYAQGRLALWWPSTSKVEPPKSLEELADARFAKIAIANPEHAPYGKAAVQALQAAGVYDAVKPKLVFGENIQQTFQFAQSGNVEAAIVALSLAIAADKDKGAYVGVEPKLHQPLIQVLVACGKGPTSELGRRFALYVNSDAGRAIMRRYGFYLPGEAEAAN